MIGIRVIEPVEFPAPVLREPRDRVPASGQQVPQVLRAPHTAGGSGSPSPRSQWAHRRPIRFLQAPTSLVQISCYPIKKVTELLFAHLRHLAGSRRRSYLINEFQALFQ